MEILSIIFTEIQMKYFKKIRILLVICVTVAFFKSIHLLNLSVVTNSASYEQYFAFEVKKVNTIIKDKPSDRPTKPVIEAGVTNEGKNFKLLGGAKSSVYENDQTCFDLRSTYKREITPRYQLDPKKFLIPTLFNGPNNQLIGFQQSVLLAIFLNR